MFGSAEISSCCQSQPTLGNIKLSAYEHSNTIPFQYISLHCINISLTKHIFSDLNQISRTCLSHCASQIQVPAISSSGGRVAATRGVRCGGIYRSDEQERSARKWLLIPVSRREYSNITLSFLELDPTLLESSIIV